MPRIDYKTKLMDGIFSAQKLVPINWRVFNRFGFIKKTTTIWVEIS